MQSGKSSPMSKIGIKSFELDNIQTFDNSGYGRKTDIWSLGVTLVEMAIGKAPFRNSAAAIYSVCVSKEYPSFPNDMSNDATSFLNRYLNVLYIPQLFYRIVTMAISIHHRCLVADSHSRASSQDLLEHPFLKNRVTSPNYNQIDRSNSVIYSSTSVCTLPPLISKTAALPPRSRGSFDAKATDKSLILNEDDSKEFERNEKSITHKSSFRRNSFASASSKSMIDEDLFFTTIGDSHKGSGEKNQPSNQYSSKSTNDLYLESVPSYYEQHSGDRRRNSKSRPLAHTDLFLPEISATFQGNHSDEGSINTQTGVLTGRSLASNMLSFEGDSDKRTDVSSTSRTKSFRDQSSRR